MGDDIPKIVNRLIKKHGTNNPFDLCKCLGYTVLFCELPDCTNGFYQYVIRNNIIYINNDRSEREQHIICGHELGHGILHKKTNSIYLDTRTFFKTSTFETEADRFSAELLIREDVKNFEGLCIHRIAKILNVPERFVELKYQ
ncbi:MAG: hypothetical protein BI182_08225 [Acetobacterium sp. MES1]|uniref:ImmA/IrrE family metallo-endopeptidase n=1 Tax=Acetobacterium sp. MES1 TaxID=1899015 RepID=UPI000B9D34C7|nr:ImmA/IrrE family metallo-endopeptidase [Acetobacterium sp. MES1]OXS26374.1 MAG: hypothetical protein BI182_08225 [Acetobacterium sp. MES1]